MEPLTTEDSILVHDLIRDDISAFDLLYKKYAEKLYMFVLKYLKSEEEAEEMVQSVFVKVWENRRNLKHELSFKSYLFTIAYNSICKVFRRRKYLQRAIEEALYLNSDITDETRECIDRKSDLERIMQIINTIPEKQREIFIKSKLENIPTKEIAKEMDMSPGTIDNYVSKSLKYIKQVLKNDAVS